MAAHQIDSHSSIWRVYLSTPTQLDACQHVSKVCTLWEPHVKTVDKTPACLVQTYVAYNHAGACGS